MFMRMFVCIVYALHSIFCRLKSARLYPMKPVQLYLDKNAQQVQQLVQPIPEQVFR